MDALSRLLTLNAPQGSIDKNCPLGGDWQLPHAAGELSVIRWHTVTQGEAQLEMPTGDAMTLTPKGGDSAAKLRPPFAPVWRSTDTYRVR